MSYFNINRLNISGPIDEYTPKCVLEEICLASSIRWNSDNESPLYRIRCCSKILSYVGENISEKYEENVSDLRIIARFVNAEHKEWRKEVLLKAYYFMREFIDEKKCKKSRTNFEVGLQTSSSPYSLNACVLYKICKVNSLHVNYCTTLNEMASLVKLFFSMQEDYLVRNDIQCKIYDSIKFTANSSSLINILTSFSASEDISNEINKNKETFVNVSHDKYSEVANNILATNSMTPENDLEAVVMAAIYYKIDLSKCFFPQKEYELLSSSHYFPWDENIKSRLYATSLYPDSLENPYLNCSFNPHFPPNMYSEEDLKILCESEGIEIAEDAYTSLQLSYLTQTFIHGKQGNILNTSTTYLDNVDDLAYDEVIVYGVRLNENIKTKGEKETGKKEGYMRAFTYTELCDTFSSYKKFIHPQTREIFSDESIRKLYLLTQKERRRNETEENYSNRLQLGDEIEKIQIYNNSNNEKLEEFLNRYESSSNEDQNKIEEILTNLLHCGMYMRNWDGKGNFPLSTSSTNYDIEKQIIIDDRVTQSLIKLEASVSSCKTLGNFILNMPLMEYSFESKQFTVSTDSNEGISIKDRIRIVRTGQNSINTSSCIRLTSNKFCATAFYYMILIGFKLPFSISEVSHIF